MISSLSKGERRDCVQQRGVLDRLKQQDSTACEMYTARRMRRKSINLISSMIRL
jgi:hypothetical protein